jgi:Ca2+-binding RTX toxin-like protein
VVDLSTGTATGEGADTFINIQMVIGSKYDDTITGEPGAYWNALVGGGGEDTIRGEAVNDGLWGGLGNDTLIGSDNNGTGWDELGGQAGNDTMEGGGGPGDSFNGGPGSDVETGGSGRDAFYEMEDHNSSDSVHAMGGDDEIYVEDLSTLSDFADGGNGTDSCYYDDHYDTVINCEDLHPFLEDAAPK